jgi:5-methylcytosine-specific restriction endonuclease McrA
MVNLCEKCWYKQLSRRATRTADNWEYIKGLIEKQNYKCAYTGVDIKPAVNASLDHIVPKTHPNFPGEDDVTNLVWCHVIVNACKNAMTPEELLDMASKIVTSSNYPISGCEVRDLESRWKNHPGRHSGLSLGQAA